MATPAQRKGDTYERDVAAYLRNAGVPIIRQHDGGTLDRGDFILGPWVVQAKAYADTTRGLREGMEGAVRAAASTGLIPAVFAKRQGLAIGASYFTMQLRDLPQLWLQLGVGPLGAPGELGS